MARVSVVVRSGPGEAPTPGCRAALQTQRVTDLEVVDHPDRATGDAIVVIGATDEIAPLGLVHLRRALDESGSDLAIGTGVEGRGPLARYASGITVQDVPALLQHDRLATMWRRDRWITRSLSWPDTVERDRGFLARALLAADTVDVVPEVVTLGQVRDANGTAVRAPRAQDLPAVADRLDDLLDVSRLIDDQETRGHWERTVVEPELRRALLLLPEAAPDVVDRLVRTAAAILSGSTSEQDAQTTVVHRLQNHLVRRGLVPQLLEVVRADRSGELTLRRALRRGRAYVADYPFRTDPELAIPEDVYRLERDLVLRAQVDQVWWDGDTLHVAGYAHLALVDADRESATSLRLALVRGGERLELPVRRVRRPDVTAATRDAPYDYDWSGFETSVAVGRLLAAPGPTRGLWRLEATVSADGVDRTRLVTATAAGAARRPERREVEDVRVVATTARGTFAVELDPVPALVTSTRIEDGAVVVDGEVRRRVPGAGTARLLVTRPSGSVVLSVDDVPVESGRFGTAIPIGRLSTAAADEPLGEGHWALQLELPGVAKPVPLRAAAGLGARRWTDGAVEVVVASAPHGRMTVTHLPARPVVEAARWVDDDLELTGRCPGPGWEASLMSRDGLRSHPLVPAVDDGRFVLRWSPGAVTTLAGTLPLIQGSWHPVVRPTGRPDDTTHLTADAEVLGRLPLRRAIGAKTFELAERRDRLEVVVGPDLFEDERGAVGQHRLHTRDFPAFVAEGLRDEVVFESYESRAYGDNARYVFEELARRQPGLRCRWVVLDGQAQLPTGIEPVRRWSRDYYEALARSRYVVVPNYRHLDDWLETPRNQVVVQTWHGAPFKKIALDNPRGEAFSSPHYLELLRRETSRWDYLLSPNPVSTPLLRQAFGYDGEMLETGYPRADVFHRPDREAAGARVRELLGIQPGRTVVLYAPTMRDDHHYGGNRFGLDLRLDLRAARTELGDDHVVLVRRHAKVVDDVGTDGVFARDVSLWPDANELLLATDVLVTDYSSLLFDFAVTGRPMLFFTYDLADYRDRLRGLYFDPARLPGPHLQTSADVVAAIRKADALRSEHAAGYQQFVSDFCPWDDGGAAARFVDRVFADHL